MVIWIGSRVGRMIWNVVEVGVGEGTMTSNEAVGMLVGDCVADDSTHGKYDGLMCGFVI